MECQRALEQRPSKNGLYRFSDGLLLFFRRPQKMILHVPDAACAVCRFDFRWYDCSYGKIFKIKEKEKQPDSRRTVWLLWSGGC
ncbi:hypothetical protein HMPREF9123_2581 [Neisseria bacilliformis ATCC BAA-1200]|uniref:Uncharacterized protein n=1 Tax=Neisseria bacilliformis ATCC BAA-1200 TaxID=888742 RepID=F2BFS4_9NEIS|nr:hypothetical protein HMPREF9123_2581 [Neisseria bacilliformis ATCC BAA-1200]